MRGALDVCAKPLESVRGAVFARRVHTCAALASRLLARRAPRQLMLTMKSFPASFTRVVCATLVLSTLAFAQVVNDGPEVFEKVDPYTKGQPAALAKLGYVQLMPAKFYDEVATLDVEGALEGAPVLWVETAHFKVGSNLVTYKTTDDAIENALLDRELKRLKPRLANAKATRVKLDPWLRLHLYAQRLEEQYADFQRRFGLHDDDADRAKKLGGAYLGEGPYLGMEQKFCVLLLEKQIAVRRFSKKFFASDSDAWQRFITRGGAGILVISSELLGSYGYKRDSDLAATVAGEMAMQLVSTFRKGGTNSPVWFRAGLAHIYAREMDPRCTLQAVGVALAKDDPTPSGWEPRVYALVADKSVAPWNEAVRWKPFDALTPPQHLASWSRVSWLLARKDTDLHAFLLGVTEDRVPLTEAERKPIDETQQIAALKAACGEDLETLDAEWKQYVLRQYAKK